MFISENFKDFQNKKCEYLKHEVRIFLVGLFRFWLTLKTNLGVIKNGGFLKPILTNLTGEKLRKIDDV